jgi:medium-chain acyl-[acyl-carrier-protein] hydrolase
VSQSGGVVVSCGRGPEVAAPALLCLPHAGAGASMFGSWAEPLTAVASVWAARMPGREKLISEEPLSTIEDMVSRLAREMSFIDSPEITLFGHCSGAILAYELASRLPGLGDNRVAKMIVSSQYIPEPGAGVAIEPLGASRQAVVRYLQEMNGTDPVLLDNTEFVDMIAPAIRADIHAAAVYRRAKAPVRLSIPIYAIGGRSDPAVTARLLRTWQDATSVPLGVRQFDGTHFFLFEQRQVVLDFFRDILLSESRSAG